MYRTTEKWEGRQAALELKPNKHWVVSFLASTPGTITNLGGACAHYETTHTETALNAMSRWILMGEVPDTFETHCPKWFEKL